MKGKLDLFFDFKIMGANAYVPFIITLLLVLYSNLRKDALTHIIPALELTFPVFAAWWSIFIFQNILEEPGSETIFSYPLSRWQVGILRVAFFFIFYVLLMIVMLLLIDRICIASIFFPLTVQLGSEAFFFAGLGFWAMTMTSNAGWSLVLIIIYSSMQILTRGALFPMINVFLFNDRLLKISELWPSSGYNLLLGAMLWIWAQIVFSKFQRYN
ncbi:MAG: hypothetical protein QHH10_03030 [Peptococcaceae bacterium]|jgi:hypothetical protein|nr:hypothetical protein [Peptococcaceae bacterium]MDH7524269.1 hypothetical protein [Peptococcaceae bacterium]